MEKDTTLKWLGNDRILAGPVRVTMSLTILSRLGQDTKGEWVLKKLAGPLRVGLLHKGWHGLISSGLRGEE